MKCEFCGKELTGNTEGCTVSEVKIGGKTYTRIKYNKKYGDYCPDCGAPAGSYHHWSCDIELCPACGGQLLAHIISGKGDRVNCPFGSVFR